MAKRNGEPLSEHLRRLAAYHLQRIRVHPDYIDAQGNVVVKPTLVCGKDTSDDIRPLKIDTTGRLDVIGVCPEHQDDAVISQASPGDGDIYDVLGTAAAPEELVRIISVAIRCTWTGQPDPLETHITLDGNSYNPGVTNPVNNKVYYNRNMGFLSDVWNYDDGHVWYAYKSFAAEAREAYIGAEVSGGTVSALDCRVKWAKW